MPLIFFTFVLIALTTTTSLIANTAAPQSETLADQRLHRIVQQQRTVYAEIGEQGDAPLTPAQESRLSSIAQQYNVQITTFPDHLSSHLLFGKFLRDIGEYAQANLIFLRANQIDPNIAVVKQQIGNYLAENGEYALALPYFLSAVELEPNEPVYHFQLGELIYRFRDYLIADGAYTRDILDQQMIQAFAKAAALAPEQQVYLYRHAEAYFDIEKPNWNKALAAWRALYHTQPSEREREVIALQTARIYLQLGEADKVRSLTAQVTSPALQEAKQSLLRALDEE